MYQLVLKPRICFILFLGLLTISMGGLLVASASQTTLIVADRELSSYWRTTYDILVRPAGIRSPIEEKHGLVEANHLSGIWGGITFEQYEAIKSIPGVEVAAPVAMLGYEVGVALGNRVTFPPYPGAYVFDETATVDDGNRTYTPPEFPRRHYYYFDRNPQAPARKEAYRDLGSLTVNHPSPSVNGTFWFPIFLAGIDPPQEAALVGLDQALLEGQYLAGNESLVPRVDFTPLPDYSAPEAQINLPVLINATTYISLSHRAELKRVALPQDVVTIEDLLARGGTDYLDGLSSETVTVTVLSGQEMYQKMIESIRSASILLGGWSAASIPSALVYQEVTPLSTYSGHVFEIQIPENPEGDQAEISYRRSLKADFNASYILDVKGIFDIENLPKPADVNRVPLETYFPPIAVLRYDGNGNPVDPPRELRPTLNPAGYIQPPPLLLTTLEAARALRGEAAISAIRVRVALEGCSSQRPEECPMTPAAQRKIEAVAIEIQRQTGLDVDIMVGSSPKRVLVHVPGIGYIEEQWIQKGVNLVYKQGIQSGHWLLLIALLVTGSFFTLDLVWAGVIAYRDLIALQKALGWRTYTVLVQIVRQVVVVGAGATAVGVLGASGMSYLLGWRSLMPEMVVGLSGVMVGLCTVSSLPPAWLASRVPPIVGLEREVRYYRKAAGTVSGRWVYAWSEIKRRPVRTVLTGIASALSAALLVLLMAATVQQRGLLAGTLLGEFILVHVEPFHYALVGVGLGLAALSTANGLLESVIERRREIGMLKAVGWRTGTVAWSFVMEGILIGMSGGLAGALLGGLAFLGLHRSLTPALAGVVVFSMAVPALVGALAALYPACVAARVSPAVVMRNE